MEQRTLRLGDILDDYCPRERRVTNHAVVAMIEQGVKQTRCTTCDTEHVYKGGKAPRRKKTETTGALYKEVLAGITDQDAPPAAGAAEAIDDIDRSDPPVLAPAPAVAVVSAPIVTDTDLDEIDPDDPPPPQIDEGPVHRQLIRAQLPRPEGIKVERQAPEFTIRQNNGRGGNGSFRGSGGGGGGDMRARGGGGGGGRNNNGAGNGAGNGHRFGRGPRPGGSGGGGGRGPNQGFGRGPGGGQQRSGRPPKRSR
jgi:hypothetical protein